jgi:hypothetical protein
MCYAESAGPTDVVDIYHGSFFTSPLSIMTIAIVSSVVLAYFIHVCLFIRYKALVAANSKGSRVLWIIASVFLGPLVWPVWWLTHRSAANTPSSVFPQESSSLSDPLISKPDIDDERAPS